MANAYPPGGTYWDNGKRSFTSVPMNLSKDSAISTTEFLEASEALTGLLDVLGSTAFMPVKKDIIGNIKVQRIPEDGSNACVDEPCVMLQKIRDRQLEAPVESETLQDLVRSELKTKKHTASEGLLWLTRGLDFIARALRRNLTLQPNEELSVSFRDSYGQTLKQYHSFIIKPIFSAAMSACPYRKDFYAKLGEDEAKVKKELDEWLAALEERVTVLNTFMAKPEAKW
ncbi:hypothetical protein LTR56_021220 [Elasticomyces elasticus]|nr:hypothetical protein LTR56_021220 [Elasticomyces elasticus]KAK3665260.1 hypothetical protein LTR22_003782 [Elasticomyces elasticus]KAK4933459.1 hypothetical protein LTR49_000453 [Elasticomyces elasticus]KAK5756390.1 hypothetical protein LTS12_013462 [Elasticomyces elasticus]